MINIGGNPLMILLAIVAALGGVGLYFVRNFRPELARDHDIFFSAIALVYGIILLAFNFRMEITTQLAQVLVVGFAGWFAVESLVLRQALANQARKSPSFNPLVEDEEPIGSDYRVEIDPTREIAPRRDRDPSRRMRGSISDSAEASELRGDTTDTRRSRRPKRSSSENNVNDSVIDIDESDISPVNPKRRPRPSGDNVNRDRPRNRNGESDSFGHDDSARDTATSGRRRRPSGRPTPYPNNDGLNTDDF
jgi:hypothetical protein